MPRPAKGIVNFSSGESCKGKTKDGKQIIGNYIQAGPTDYVFIRGVVATREGLASPFEPTQIFKVLRSSLKKTQK